MSSTKKKRRVKVTIESACTEQAATHGYGARSDLRIALDFIKRKRFTAAREHVEKALVDLVKAETLDDVHEYLTACGATMEVAPQ